MFHNTKYPKDKKYMGTLCQYKMHGDALPIKMHGDRLPIQNAWGHFANKKCMGTDCQYKIHGDTLPGDSLPIKNIWGHFSNIANKYIYTHKIKTMHGMRTGVHSLLYI
jgi:hypothetical protein